MLLDQWELDRIKIIKIIEIKTPVTCKLCTYAPLLCYQSAKHLSIAAIRSDKLLMDSRLVVGGGKGMIKGLLGD